MHKHRKNTALILLAAVILILFTGCGENAAAEAGTEIPAEADGSVSAGWAELPDEESLPEEFRYTFRPHVLSGGYAEIYGESFREEYFAFCDAVLSGSSSFPCSSRERFFRFLSVSNYCFPLAGAVVDRDRSTVAQGVCTLAYLYDEPELKEKISSFREKVTEVISAAVPYDEPDPVKAMELYTAVARKDTYDYETTLDDSLSLGSFRAVMEDTGICQEIAGEYIYYLLQVGIEAIPCSGLSADKSMAHDWALAELDGKWYHIDPTFAVNYPDALFFFGMDDVQRSYYGDLPADGFTYADSDLPDPSRYAAGDRRFEKYWLAESYTIDHARGKISVTIRETGEEMEYDLAG